MRTVLQRVNSASVALPNGERRIIGKGLLIYLGIGKGDTLAQAQRLAEKTLNLRIFPHADSKFDKSVLDVKGEILVISQFTLYGNPWAGRRPDFTSAAAPADAKRLYEEFATLLANSGLTVKTGEFAAHMLVESVNDGPVTIQADLPPAG